MLVYMIETRPSETCSAMVEIKAGSSNANITPLHYHGSELLRQREL